MYLINGTDFSYSDQIDDDRLWQSFNQLSINTFGIDFNFWRDAGYFTKSYIPHMLIHNGNVVSNVSANIIKFFLNGIEKKYIQIGTVMTDPQYQRRGLSSFLMRKIIEKYKDECDAIYLYANDRVLNFYPKFGFAKEKEYKRIKRVNRKCGSFRKLNMELENDRELLLKKYVESNPFSEINVFDNVGLLMFYCLGCFKNNIYYLSDYDVIAIAEHGESEMICYELLGTTNAKLDELLGILLENQTTTVSLGFPLIFTDDSFIVKSNICEDTTLFVYSNKENIFKNQTTMLPLLSHA